MARPLPENDLLASTLVEDRSSDFEEMVLRFHEYGDQWLVLGRYGFNRTHLVPLVPEQRVFIASSFGSIGWYARAPVRAECGAVLHSRFQALPVLAPDATITCPTCRYAHEGWL